MPRAHPLVDLLNAPWAIVPDRLLEIQAIYAAHVRGERQDLEAVAARLGRATLENDPQGYIVQDGVAIVPLQGVLSKRANMFSDISGGASHELFARDVARAAADPMVSAILIDADTPGGTVSGTVQSAEAVRAARQLKPTAVWASGLMASAGVWIGVEGELVVAGDAATGVGSIGVVATHVDVSQAERMMGRKTTEITAGKYKRIASAYQPLSEAGREAIQAEVDYLYSVFVDAVAAARNTTPADVLARAADGRMFYGQQAIDAGLVDQIATQDETLRELRSRAASRARTTVLVNGRRAEDEGTTTATEDATDMSNSSAAAPAAAITAASVAADHPQVAAELREQGAAAERERILAVRAQAVPGHEALIEQLAMDGKTTGPEAAVAVLNAHRAAMAKQTADIRADRPAPLPAGATATGDQADKSANDKPKDPMAEARELAAAISAKQAAAAATGRTLSATEALSLIQKEQ